MDSAVCNIIVLSLTGKEFGDASKSGREVIEFLWFIEVICECEPDLVIRNWYVLVQSSNLEPMCIIECHLEFLVFDSFGTFNDLYK